MREERWEEGEELLRRKFGEVPPGDRLVLALARGDTAAASALLRDGPQMARRKGRRTDNLALEAGWLLATYLEDVDRADSMVRFAAVGDLEPTTRASAHHLLAKLAVAGGRWSAAQAALTQSERLTAVDSALLGRAMAASLPFLGVPPDAVRAVRARLEGWTPGAERGIPLSEPARPLAAHLQHYLSGLLSVRLGETAAALRHAGALEELEAPADARPLVRALGRTIRADIAVAAGRTEEALDLLEGATAEIPFELIRLPYFSGEHARYLRGLSLHRTGRDEEGLEFLASALSGTPAELHYRAPVHLLRGQMLQRLNRRAQAAEEYSRFLNLWKSCDPALRPVVDRARAELTALTAEPR